MKINFSFNPNKLRNRKSNDILEIIDFYDFISKEDYNKTILFINQEDYEEFFIYCVQSKDFIHTKDGESIKYEVNNNVSRYRIIAEIKFDF